MNDYLNNKDKQLSRYSDGELAGLVQAEVAEVLAFAAALTRRTGLGMSEMAALEHIQQADGRRLTPTQLGRRLSLSSGAITALVDRLERAGYVERRPNPDDRRSSVISLVPENLAEALRHMLPLQADLVEASATLNDEERTAVGAYLKTLTRIFARHARS